MESAALLNRRSFLKAAALAGGGLLAGVSWPAAAAKLPSIPGNSRWGLAPASMAWQGKSLGEICAQIKDPKRNGGRSLAEIQRHMGTDDLVSWAWRPGEGRKPAPGTQVEFGMLIQAWIESGAHCPTS